MSETASFLGTPRHAPRGVGHLRAEQPFPVAARTALANTQLRRNIGHATSTIRAKRAAVVGEVPDWEELRRAGQQIKASVMADLPALLDRLTERVSARGGMVHRARDAVEACATVSRLVRETGEHEVVKVKSMATQEIGLNEALEADGVTAYETDLAELIVQLGGDAPSHILVPAIHRNRSEIRDIFAHEMPDAPTDLTDDPGRLAMAARAHLRRKFLSAKVAVSGANFAVAETGTLLVVESEGNGRMCLTLPQTLITVMGIEKLVPTWRDLEVFLQLLPRSSTGERMNPYTSAWTGVHTLGDGQVEGQVAGLVDGPGAFHLVLLDNGRTATLADPVGREALHCIRCSACLNVCPVYERTGGHAYGSVYPGPIGAVLSPQLTGVEDNASLPYASSLCGACYDVCPVRIDIPSILVHLRARHVEEAKATSRRPTAEAVAMAAASWVMADPQRFAAAERALGAGRLLARANRRGQIASLPFPLSSWTTSRDLPPPPAETFRRWWARTHPADKAVPAAPGDARVVSSGADTPVSPPRTDHTGGGGSGTAASAGRASPEVTREYRTHGEHEPGSAAVLDQLVDRLEDYRATVRRCAPAELGQAVQAALAEAGADGDPERVLLAPGLPDWAPAGRPDDGRLIPAELDAFAAVVTACRVACSETGTIVLDGGSDQGRRAITLVPDVHVCVVRSDQVVQTVPEMIAALDATRPLTFISGPSATSDIELSRVEGVHGPRTLSVVLVE